MRKDILLGTILLITGEVLGLAEGGGFVGAQAQDAGSFDNDQVLNDAVTAGGIDDTAALTSLVGLAQDAGSFDTSLLTAVDIDLANIDLASNSEVGVSVSDCTGLKVAFQANCHCGVEYTHSGSLGPFVDKSECPKLFKAYKDCDCSQ